VTNDAEIAFNDVVECGPMMREVCSWDDLNPEYASAAFIRWFDIH